MKELKIKYLLYSFWYSIVKWIVLKPLLKLGYIINGKLIGEIKWYQKQFTTPVKNKILSDITFQITKYIMFKPNNKNYTL